MGSDIAELLGNKTNLAKGVHIQMDGRARSLPSCPVLMAYGHTIPEVGKAVQDAVKNSRGVHDRPARLPL
ncbi:MAG: hypothetical protein ACLUJG_08325 [Lawsonibacter sp.]